LWETILATLQDSNEDVVKAEVLTDMALYYQRHGSDQELEKAVSYMQQAVKVYQQTLADTSNNLDETSILPALAAATLHLALLHQQSRQWEAALQAFNDGVQYQQRVLGTAHGAVADTYQNMGHLHGQLQQFDEAATAYRQALTIYQNIAQTMKDSTEISSVLPSQAGAHHNLGLALQYEVAQIMGNHSTASTSITPEDKQQLGKLIEEAITQLQTALQLRQSVLGTQHVDTAGSHMALAQFLSQLQQSEVAVQHFAAAAQIWQDLLDATSNDGTSSSSSAPQTLSPSQIPLARRHLATVYNNKGAATQQMQQHANEEEARTAAESALQDYIKAKEALQPLLTEFSSQGISPSLMIEWVTTHNSMYLNMSQLRLPLHGSFLFLCN
jgi:tetratricopeptide (TPR) repeat protein